MTKVSRTRRRRDRQHDGGSTFGSRLREERARIGLAQADLAAIGGVGRSSQNIYETDVRCPDVRYLQRVRAVGIDVVYLLTSERKFPHPDGMLSVSSETLKRIFEFVLDARREGAPGSLERARLLEMFMTLCVFSSEGRTGDPQALRALLEDLSQRVPPGGQSADSLGNS